MSRDRHCHYGCRSVEGHGRSSRDTGVRARRFAFLHSAHLLPGLTGAVQPWQVKIPRPARIQAEFHALRKVAIRSSAFMYTNSLLGLRARSMRSISNSSPSIGIVRGPSFFVVPGSRRISAFTKSTPKNLCHSRLLVSSLFGQIRLPRIELPLKMILDHME